jgi:hypothetical protein
VFVTSGRGVRDWLASSLLHPLVLLRYSARSVPSTFSPHTLLFVDASRSLTFPLLLLAIVCTTLLSLAPTRIIRSNICPSLAVPPSSIPFGHSRHCLIQPTGQQHILCSQQLPFLRHRLPPTNLPHLFIEIWSHPFALDLHSPRSSLSSLCPVNFQAMLP